MTENEKHPSIRFKVSFKQPWTPGVGEDYEDATELRIYDDGIWEFLDKNGLPICQGVDASVECDHTNPSKADK